MKPVRVKRVRPVVAAAVAAAMVVVAEAAAVVVVVMAVAAATAADAAMAGSDAADNRKSWLYEKRLSESSGAFFSHSVTITRT
jgi:hypothetical protein